MQNQIIIYYWNKRWR